MAGLFTLSPRACGFGAACGACGERELCGAPPVAFGVGPLDPLSMYLRSSFSEAIPATGCGEWRGDRPRGELVRWVPNVAPFRAVDPGVVGRLGAVKGPV